MPTDPTMHLQSRTQQALASRDPYAMTKINKAKRHGGITKIALFSSMIYPLKDVNKV